MSGPPGDGWTLVFRDEFDGSDAELDATWEFQHGPSGHILCSRWRDNAVLENGWLRLVARRETRAGQDWTAASCWSRKQFQYGYFECRYRYAPATGTNNSFWIMSRGLKNRRFEIDINEGHYPNEVNMNLHSHAPPPHWAKGGRWYAGGGAPGSGQDDAGFMFVLDVPIRARQIRFVSRDADAARVMELRLFPPSAEGYPSVFPNPMEAQPDVPNLAPGTKVTASSQLDERYGPEKAVDGELGTPSRWVSARGETEHVLTLDLEQTREIGCLQFISGWQQDGQWRDIVQDFAFEYRDGEVWRPIPGARRTALGTPGQDLPEEQNLGRTFHTYGLLWTEDELIYYVDGQPIRRQEHSICNGPAPVWLSLAILNWAGPITDAIDGVSMDVDYVRIWQR